MKFSQSNDAVEKIDAVDSDEIRLQEQELSIQVENLMQETTSKEEHGLRIGCEFTSYADLYERSTFVQLYKRSSRGFPGYAKKCPKKTLNSELIYSELDVGCSGAVKLSI